MCPPRPDICNQTDFSCLHNWGLFLSNSTPTTLKRCALYYSHVTWILNRILCVINLMGKTSNLIIPCLSVKFTRLGVVLGLIKPRHVWTLCDPLLWLCYNCYNSLTTNTYSYLRWRSQTIIIFLAALSIFVMNRKVFSAGWTVSTERRLFVTQKYTFLWKDHTKRKKVPWSESNQTMYKSTVFPKFVWKLSLE